MKRSLSRVLSIILTVAMMITLLPATLVSAAYTPVFTLSIVDSEGEALEELYPGISAYLRVRVSGIKEFHNMAVNVTATNARFGTDVNGLIKRYDSSKKDITGVNGELWHFRYVGVENAKKIYESGMCLEEYVRELELKNKEKKTPTRVA